MEHVYVYIVRKTAVYNHETMGVYLDKRQAKEQVESYINGILEAGEDRWGDADGHHQFEIGKVWLGKPIDGEDMDIVANYSATNYTNNRADTFEWRDSEE